jgi:hypothetical protein
MQIRHHPRMTYQGRAIWPPVWIWLSGLDKTQPAIGEVGVLTQVQFSRTLQSTLFLTIEIANGSRYVGSLKFDNPHFAEKVRSVLHQHIDYTIKDIAAIDMV